MQASMEEWAMQVTTIEKKSCLCLFFPESKQVFCNETVLEAVNTSKTSPKQFKGGTVKYVGYM